VYLILGAAGSGRREVLTDLIEGGLAEGDRAAVMLAEGEPADTFDAKLPGLARWRWTEEATIEGELPRGETHVLFVSDGRRNPVEQIEVFKAWLEVQGGELARVLCIVNCQLVEKNPALLAWYEACVHFADVVLLNKRDGVANKWLSDFQAHFKKQFLPCLFELVKGGRVKNPALVLVPEARRMSHFLDAEQDWIFTDAEGEVIEEDPYFVRDAAGRRAKKIPDIAKYL